MKQIEQDMINNIKITKENMDEAIRIHQIAKNRYYSLNKTFEMTLKIICDGCGEKILDCNNYIQLYDGTCFHNEDCERRYYDEIGN